MRAGSIPSVKSLKDIFFDEQGCITWLFEQAILEDVTTCDECAGNVKRYGKMFKCTHVTCKNCWSIFRATFFAGMRIKCCEALYMCYLWLTGCSAATMLAHTGHSAHTVSSYNGFFRQLVASTLDSDDMIIGGAGIVVQVDETKMGRRKYNKGHRVEGAWVIVGVELTDERRVFAEVMEDRSASTIADVLSRHIAEGSILHTDCWRGYTPVAEQFGIKHQTVNHSVGFKDENTGVHTNHVEGTNYALKRAVPPRNRTREHLQPFLLEFVWMGKNEDHLWQSLVDALRDVVYE